VPGLRQAAWRAPLACGHGAVRFHLPLGGSDRAAGLLAYWTRKEAVVKATGEGLRVPLTDLHVSAPDQSPRLLAWYGRPELTGRLQLHALNPGPGYAACLALIDQPHAAVYEIPATDLLGT
jgi:4'-phosphopantetheinyl transferase